MKRATALWMSAALVLLGVAWRTAPATAPPLYDGVCVANPYQYLDPPQGAPTTPPTSAKHTVSVSNDVVPGTIVPTGEFPAQAQLSTDDGSIVAHGAHKVTITIDAVHPPAVPPRNGSIDGNVYRIGISADNGAPVSIDAGKPLTLTLRLPSAGGQSDSVEAFSGAGWSPLASQPDTCLFSYSASVTQAGSYALVGTGGSASASPGITPLPGDRPGGGTGTGSAGSSVPVPVIVLAAVVLLLGGGVALLRRRNLANRTRRPRRGPPR